MSKHTTTKSTTGSPVKNVGRFLLSRERSAPAPLQKMEAFAQELKANPGKAKAFFKAAGILSGDGKLTASYRTADE